MRARYFNNIIKKDNVVTKSSTDIYKIKSEFKYYYLLPEELRKFYVKPYNYRENENEALYDMDYAGITLFEFLNTSIIHTDGETFDKAIDLVIKQLKEYFILKSKYNKIVSNDNFILNKVINRIDKLKKLPEYRNLNLFLNMTNTNLDELVSSFKDDYNNINELNVTKTISHGDLHFSNILINEKTFEIKFIDVRGAMHEDDLYIDQYYDYAKLAHSIQGLYDYIVNDEFKLKLTDNLDTYNIEFHIYTRLISEYYVKIWDSVCKDLIDDNDYEIIRIYTKSLFLSMLPLHKENLKHIVAFIKISDNIPIISSDKLSINYK